MVDFSVKTGIRRALLLALCWWTLTEGASAWAFGAPVIVLAVMASLRLGPARHRPMRGLPFFLAFFLWHSLRGGVDVARRALHPRLPLAPTFMDFPLRLNDQAARVFLANTINLLPGTLTADFRGPLLRVHVLDRNLPNLESLRSLEERVAALFGLRLDQAEGMPHG